MSDEPERMDSQIDDVLGGRGGPAADPTVLWLASAARPGPSPALLARIDDQVAATAPAARRQTDRPGRMLTLVAAALAVAFVFQGVGNLVAGEWISEGIGEPYGPHSFFEGGLAMLAAAVCAAAATVRRSWSTLSVLTCSPLALSLGLHGTGEIGVFAAGVALHLTEGALGLLLILAWWLDRRDSARGPREDQA
jgi:hypothetical protein